jgi:hypothetical protein
MGRLALVFILLTALVSSARAKCGPLLLRINGETKTHSSTQKILITITPELGHSKPLVLVDDKRFEADVYYDPYKSYSRMFGYNCTKRPEHVTVALLDNGKEIDKVDLAFSKDFVADRDGSYALRSKLRLGK